MVTFSKRSSRTKAKKKNSKQRKTKKRSVKRQNGPKSKTRQRSHTTSKSQTVTPTKEKEKEKENSEERKKKQQARVEDFREKEPSSEGKKNGGGGGGQGEKTNESVSKSKGSQVVPSSQLVEQPPKKIEVKNMDPDEKKMKHLIKKLKKEKLAPRPPSIPLDEKSRLLMDRVVKKPYPQRYRIKSKEELLMDEKSSFFKVSVPSNRATNSQAKKPVEKEEDPYADCPKLAEVLKMPPCKGVFNDKDVPFWAEYCEPTETDMAGMDHAEAVNSEHIEMLQEKKFQLKTVSEKVTLDTFQPLTSLKDRDEKHFNEALVFSNTIRTVINIQNLTSEATSGQLRGKRETAKLKTKNSKVTIPENVVPECYVYARSDPFTITRAPKTTNALNTAISGE